ncbi:MAG: putative TIM-barrel fold metal-dependent hydrolase [Limisphaerales bacterium]|jgi:predicted TIM-barrel fold metal-dependent hydrolase
MHKFGALMSDKVKSTYANGRRMFDSDSHIMETLDWLSSYATPEQEGLIGPLATEKGGANVVKAIQIAQKRAGDKAATQALREAPLISGPKGWAAYGAFDPTERSDALNLLGFEKQLVFPTFSIGQFAHSKKLDKLYAGADMLNRHMADFCRDDERLQAVGYVPLLDAKLAEQAVRDGIAQGIQAFWVSSDPVDGRSPSHTEHDGVWDLLQASNVPVVLHIGGGRGLNPAYHNNGQPKPSDWLGGGENLRGRDFHAVSHSPQNFLTTMIYDQVFQRFPRLMCGVIEIGATWVPSFLRILDQGQQSFRKSEPLLDTLELTPSEFFRRNVRVSLFPFEDAGWLIDQVGPEAFMFASDYPHPEGGRDPVGRFDSTLEAAETAQVDRDAFYFRNYASLMNLQI